MKIIIKSIKWILAGISILIATFAVYLLIVGLIPNIEVPKQPVKKMDREIPPLVAKAFPERKTVTYTVDGTPIRAWFYPPRDSSAPAPCVVMGHGFGGTKAAGLDNYAVRYQAVGLSVLAFDYRHFGDSGGEPRQLIWIPYQLEDWAAAVQYARSRKDVDPEKIALWGS